MKKMMKSENSLPESRSAFNRLIPLLKSGQAQTLIELARKAGLDREIAAKYLSKMAIAGTVKTRRNRKRIYYFISDSNHAKDEKAEENISPKNLPKGMKYCRHCYKHLAGYMGVMITRALIKNGFLDESEAGYTITSKGWRWFAKWEIKKENLNPKKTFAKQCLDFSERRNHLGGQLGDALLKTMMKKQCIKQVPNSREIKITQDGWRWLAAELGIHADFDN